MLKPEQVPEAAWQAASGLWFNGAKWPQIVAAALNAWPGMHLGAPWVIGVPNATSIILPLPQEASDDQ